MGPSVVERLRNINVKHKEKRAAVTAVGGVAAFGLAGTLIFSGAGSGSSHANAEPTPVLPPTPYVQPLSERTEEVLLPKVPSPTEVSAAQPELTARGVEEPDFASMRPFKIVEMSRDERLVVRNHPTADFGARANNTSSMREFGEILNMTNTPRVELVHEDYTPDPDSENPYKYKTEVLEDGSIRISTDLSQIPTDGFELDEKIADELFRKAYPDAPKNDEELSEELANIRADYRGILYTMRPFRISARLSNLSIHLPPETYVGSSSTEIEY